jgi:rfaE bifunctional protein kinase chain/domain
MMLDEYIIGKVDRISPEAPVPVVNVESESFVLGGAANVVNNLSSLGVKVYAVGVIGDDDNGRKLEKEFAKRGVITEGMIVDKERPTIIKKRVLAQHQQLLRLDWEKKGNIVSYVEDAIIDSVRKNIDKIDAIILSDYDKGLLTKRVAEEIIKIANNHNKIVTVDPKPENSENYKNATSMTPNTKEALACIKGMRGDTEEDILNLGSAIKEKLNLANLLITRSEKGMTIFEKDGPRTIPTVAKEVYDVTGAGDTVIAVFTLSAAAGADFYEAARIANTAAGVVVGKLGTATVTKEEIVSFYEEIYK